MRLVIEVATHLDGSTLSQLARNFQ